MSTLWILAGDGLTVAAYELSRMLNRRHPSPLTTLAFCSKVLIVSVLVAS